MELSDFSKLLLPEIEKEMIFAIDNDIHNSYSDVKSMMKYHFGWNESGNNDIPQGKRIRPLLLLLSCIVSGGDWRTALPGAVAIELIHNFSLIHDDIEDQSDVRRGRKTLWKMVGMPQALNTGDAMFALAQINMLKLGASVSKPVAFEAMKILNETCLTLTGGQNLDIAFETNDFVSEEDYFVMIGGKTAALLAASCELGAVIAQTSAHNQRELHSFGESIGLAFQAWDDWLGIWGDAQKTGKSTSSDLINKKKTLPILYAIQKSQEFRTRFLNEKITTENLSEFTFLIEECGAKEYTENLSKHYSDLAEISIHSIISSNDEAVNALKEILRSLLNRDN